MCVSKGLNNLLFFPDLLTIVDFIVTKKFVGLLFQFFLLILVSVLESVCLSKCCFSYIKIFQNSSQCDSYSTKQLFVI